jgi:GntR family transcriptional regulator
VNPRRQGPDSVAVSKVRFGSLKRGGPIPLYYQLQELLKQEIESGRWVPGDRLPSETELAATFEVNRVVVRQALEILRGDGQIVRRQGMGTFVSTPKIDHRAGGLVSMLQDNEPGPIRILLLDSVRTVAHGAIRENLKVSEREPVLCLTTKLSVQDVPLAIGRSYFRWNESRWLRDLAGTGDELPLKGDAPARFGEPIRSNMSVESTLADPFESKHLTVAEKSPVFLVLCTETILDGEQEHPYEVARLVYRTDVVQFNLAVPPSTDRVSAILGVNVS